MGLFPPYSMSMDASSGVPGGPGACMCMVCQTRTYMCDYMQKKKKWGLLAFVGQDMCYLQRAHCSSQKTTCGSGRDSLATGQICMIQTLEGGKKKKNPVHRHVLGYSL